MDNPENNEGAITNGQSRETGNIGYTRGQKPKQKHTTICVGHHYTQRNTNNVNKTRAFLQTTGGKTHKTMKNSKDIIVLQMFRQQRKNIRTL